MTIKLFSNIYRFKFVISALHIFIYIIVISNVMKYKFIL